MAEWVEACDADVVEEQDVIRFDHEGRTFAIFRSPDDQYFATDGLCTHEKVHLADGLVIIDYVDLEPGDPERTLDRRLILATAVGMDALQAR